ncbi:Outer membrane protein TolC [Flavobacteriaceae bacterium MAR_2010_188]|nr:Outer membrane protein TolC [Flavobacteriaceae bacterium MAR_2010_188]
MRQIINSCVFLFTVLLSAQETPSSLSLQEAIDYALENNRTSKNAALDIDAAEQQKWETTATGLPQIKADVDYQNFLKQQVSLLPAAAFDPLGSIRQLGDYYDLTDRQIKDLPAAPQGFLPLTFGTKQNVSASATLSQLIFDGSYIVALQSAKVFLQISENAKKKTDLEVRKSVIDAYGNVLLAEESLDILERNMEVLDKNLFEVTKIFENGLGEEESVEQLKITISGVESNLNNVKRLRTLSYQMLNIVLALPINAEVSLTDNLQTLTEENISISLIETDFKVENTIDYRIAENDKRIKDLMLKLEKSKALPTIGSFLNAGYSAFSDEFTFLNKDQQWFGSAVIGVSLDIPIFSSFGRSAATKRAAINVDKAETDLLETEQRLRLQINSAKSDYQFAIEEYRNKEENLRLAERIEAKNQTKFFEGISTSFELRQAQTQLYTAQQEFLQAMLNVITAKAGLETIINQPNLN